MNAMSAIVVLLCVVVCSCYGRSLDIPSLPEIKCSLACQFCDTNNMPKSWSPIDLHAKGNAASDLCMDRCLRSTHLLPTDLCNFLRQQDVVQQQQRSGDNIVKCSNICNECSQVADDFNAPRCYERCLENPEHAMEKLCMMEREPDQMVSDDAFSSTRAKKLLRKQRKAEEPLWNHQSGQDVVEVRRVKRKTPLVLCLRVCEQCINTFGRRNYNGQRCAHACVLSGGNSLDPDCENPNFYSVW